MRHEPSFTCLFVISRSKQVINASNFIFFFFIIIHRTVRGVPNHLIGLLPTYDDNSSDNSEDQRQQHMRQQNYSSNTTTSTTGATTTTTTTTTTSGTSGSGGLPYHRNVVLENEKYHTGVPINSLDDHSTSSNIVEETSGGTSTHNRSSNVCDSNVNNGDGDEEEEEEEEENDYDDPDNGDGEEDVEEASDQEQALRRQMMKLNLIEHNIMLPSELELKYKKVKNQNNAEMDAILIEAISPPPGAPPKSENPARLRRYHRLN